MSGLKSKLQLLRSHFWFQVELLVFLCLTKIVKTNPFALQHSLIVLICVACYASSLHGDFVFDDSVAIVRNVDVTNASTPLIEIFRHDFWGHNLTDPTSHKSFRPLTTLMFQWEVRWFGLQAAPMKFHNFLLHIVVCWLLLSVLPRIFPQIDTAMLFLATALFAVHPVHTEAVSGVVGRAELLCSLFYLMAVLMFLSMENESQTRMRERIIGYSGVVLCSSIALLCKEVGITAMVKSKHIFKDWPSFFLNLK